MTTDDKTREDRVRALLSRRGYALRSNGTGKAGEPAFNILDGDGMPVKGLISEGDRALYAVNLTLEEVEGCVERTK